MGMRDVLRLHKPDALLVHGDTSTTLATAMAGFYMGVPVGHVEAGMRTHDLQAPFPEEFNRQVASKVTKWHFAPTEFSRQNLLAERVPEASITVTGNTVIDAMFWVLGRIYADTQRRDAIAAFLNEQLNFDWLRQRFVLMTGHRRENFGDGFLQICHALKDLASHYPAVQFVYPVHLNPNVQQPVNAILAALPNVHLIAPLDYEPFVYLLKHSHIVLTDSGGIQEEAPTLNVPVLIMRDTTERMEGVEAGCARLVGTEVNVIVSNFTELVQNVELYNQMSAVPNPYGDGTASKKIVTTIENIYA
jgi:UDP-N-acetylglucosamine 2-epimerase (non-hydrolysing)